MTDGCGPLRDGQKVVIVGGGPAGASCGITLMRLARQYGRAIRVILFESKDFSREHNVCVGVVSPPFESILHVLGLALPERLVEVRIGGYMLHGRRTQLHLNEDEFAEAEPTYSVHRGQLDAFMLESAIAAGVEVRDDLVVDLRVRPDRVLAVSSGGSREVADVAVAAVGLAPSALRMLESQVSGYHRPKSVHSILTEIPMTPEEVTLRMDGTVHVLLQSGGRHVDFAAITPKRASVVINIAGDDVDEDDMTALLALPEVRPFLPEGATPGCYEYNEFPGNPARHIYADRVVTIGNTSGLMRPLKGKGINTGMLTGIRVAQTLMRSGCSRHAFDSFYRSMGDVTSEFRYGGWLRRFYRLAKRLDALDPALELAKREPRLAAAFHDMVSGEGNYEQVAHNFTRPRVLARLFAAEVRARLKPRS